jgi:hypothetical protein
MFYKKKNVGFKGLSVAAFWVLGMWLGFGCNVLRVLAKQSPKKNNIFFLFCIW